MKKVTYLFAPLLLLATPVLGQSIIGAFEMTSNGSGPIVGTTGFDVTTPTTAGAYTADWYRDVLLSPNVPPTILNLPAGMQDAGGWYFVVAGDQSVDNFDFAVSRWTRSGLWNFRLEGNTYEIRFTTSGGVALKRFQAPFDLVPVPFELWFLGETPDDASDDVRMAPVLFDDNSNGVFDFKLDHLADDGNNDPSSDWIYFYMPVDTSPGQSGYEAFELDPFANIAAEHLARVVLMNWDQHQNESGVGAGDGPVGAMPEAGTTFRITANDLPPECFVAGVVDGFVPSFNVEAFDTKGLAAINVLKTTHAKVTIPPFTPGEQFVFVTISRARDNDDDDDDVNNKLAFANSMRGTADWFARRTYMAADTDHSDLLGIAGGMEPPRHLSKRFAAHRPSFVPPSPNRYVSRKVHDDHEDVFKGFGAVLELIDTAGNVFVCEQSLDWPVHNVGNLALLMQPNSNLGGFPTSFFGGGDAVWPRGGEIPHLFSGNLWVGVDLGGDKRVMDNFFNFFGGDWTQTDASVITEENDVSDQDLSLVFDDRHAFDFPPFFTPPIGLEVRQRSFQWKSSKRDDFIIIAYEITNTGLNGDLSHVLAALYLDPDIGDPFTDQADFDPSRNMMYQFDDGGVGGYLGLMVLGESPSVIRAFTGGVEDPTDDFDRYDNFLQGGVGALPAFQPDDIRIIATGQPFELRARRSKTVVFGMVLGEDLEALQKNADQMVRTYRDEVRDELEDDGFDKRADAALPSVIELRDAYPNPFNPSTTIGFALPEASDVRLIVFDLLGREVARLVDQRMTPGSHEVTWTSSGMPSGVYMYRLQAGDRVETKSVTVLK